MLDRTKEPGAVGEPLYLDVVARVARGPRDGPVAAVRATRVVIGGRYGLSSRRNSPRPWSRPCSTNLSKRQARSNHFTVGIIDDVTHTVAAGTIRDFDIEPDDVVRAVFFGLGADGTVGANKNSIKIIGEETDNYAQGYFVYDSKKSGVDHHLAPALRPAPDPLPVPDQQGELRRLPPVRLPREVRHARVRRPGRQSSCSTRPTARTRSGTTCPARSSSDDHRQEAEVLRDRRLQGGRRDRHGQPHQHDHADLLLRHLRRAAARGGHRPDQEGDREDLRQEGRGGRQAELRRGRRDARATCTRSRFRRRPRAQARMPADGLRRGPRLRPARARP